MQPARNITGRAVGARHGKNGVILVPDDLRRRVQRLYAKVGQRQKTMALLNANEMTFAALVEYGALRYDVIDRITQVLEDIGA
jgi:hypothetical protein